MRRATRSGPIFALLAVQVLFGVHYLVAKAIVAQVPPAGWAMVRAATAAAVLLAATALRGHPLPSGAGTRLRFAGLAVLGVSANQLLFVEGLARTTSGHSSLINTAAPVFVLSLAVALGRERASGTRLAGVGLTLAGVLLLLGSDRLAIGTEVTTGDLFTLANVVCFSLFLVLGKPVFERERTLPATALLFAFGTLWLLPVGAPVVAGIDVAAVPARIWGLAAFAIAGPTIGAYMLNTYALRRVDSSLVALFVYLQPLIGAGLSIALGREPFTRRLVLSAAIVFAGVALATRPLRAAAEPAPR